MSHRFLKKNIAVAQSPGKSQHRLCIIEEGLHRKERFISVEWFYEASMINERIFHAGETLAVCH